MTTGDRPIPTTGEPRDETARPAKPEGPPSPSTYLDGRVYRVARGSHAPRQTVEDGCAASHAVVDLSRERLSTDVWLARIVREMRIRFYLPKTVKTYRLALEGALRWFGGAPHELTREDVRDYLELLVDGGAGASWVGVHLSALRTAFDKMCGRQITLGLATPRRARNLPVVLSGGEIMRLLEGAPALRDKLLLGLMYATGLRVSEVVRLRWRDLDAERRAITVRQGKGRKDRQVMLPESFAPLLRRLASGNQPEQFIFWHHDPDRHLSPRAAERVMERTAHLAKIGKRIGCHSLRHSFATHLLENGVDIRFIQRLLGHAKLDTTRLYTHVATVRVNRVASPLDTLLSSPQLTSGVGAPALTGPASASAAGPVRRPAAVLLPPPPAQLAVASLTTMTRQLTATSQPTIAPQPRTAPRPTAARRPGAAVQPATLPVGRMRFSITRTPDGATAAIWITSAQPAIELTGIRLFEPRPGWVAIELPPTEQWATALERASPAERKRLDEPAFYETVRAHLTRQYLALTPASVTEGPAT